jgi:hypothetical protein
MDMQLLIEVLLHLDSSKSPIHELYQICDQFIERDTKDWESVLAFVGVYDSFNPIKWYTKETFVYRFLNEILRSGDIDKIILLSCFENEKEILFMLDSVFCIEDVHANETNESWIVEMSLYGKKRL